MTGSPFTQYDIQIATNRVDGYFFPRPGEEGEQALSRAKAECLLDLKRHVACIETMTLEQFSKAKARIQA